MLRIFQAVWCVANLAQEGFGDLRNIADRGSKTHTSWLPPRSLDQWKVRQTELRRQVLASAGLFPLPERTPLRAARFGRANFPEFSVEKVVFESLPGLTVHGNLYLPRDA